MRELTIERGQRVLDYVNKHILENGYPPSVREICSALHFKSTSTVHTYLNRLEADGKIKKAPTKPRALRVMQDNSEDTIGSTVIQRFRPDSETVYVPVVGKVTAGLPILASENIEYSFPVPSFFTGDSDTFILRVAGDSMVNAGIQDRDYILVRQQSSADNGEIVVALIGDESTVKTFYREKNRVRLQPENDRYDPIFIYEDCSIIGKVIGIFRKL